MRVLASADVHGRWPVYLLLLTMAREHHVAAIVLAGDLLGDLNGLDTPEEAQRHEAGMFRLWFFNTLRLLRLGCDGLSPNETPRQVLSPLHCPFGNNLRDDFPQKGRPLGLELGDDISSRVGGESSQRTLLGMGCVVLPIRQKGHADKPACGRAGEIGKCDCVMPGVASIDKGKSDGMNRP